MNPTTCSAYSATMPMQSRCRKQLMNSSSVHGYSKLADSMSSTAWRSLRINHLICTVCFEFADLDIDPIPFVSLRESPSRQCLFNIASHRARTKTDSKPSLKTLAFSLWYRWTSAFRGLSMQSTGSIGALATCNLISPLGDPPVHPIPKWHKAR